jgi:hypothetical protein
MFIFNSFITLTTKLMQGQQSSSGQHCNITYYHSWRTTIARIEPQTNSGSSWRTTTARTGPTTDSSIRNERQYSVRPFGTNSLKEGAVWSVWWNAVVARQPKVKHLHGYAHHLSTVAWMLVAQQPIVGRPVFPLREPDVIKVRQYTQLANTF